MDVSIIYVNYKTSALVINSIASVKRLTTGISYEIIVVDNHSEDQSLKRIKDEYPDVICIASDTNEGFGRANNIGLKQAKGRNILFLNPDTLLINNAIQRLSHFLDSTPKAAVCGGNLFDEEGNPTTSLGRRYPSFWLEVLSIFYLSPIIYPHRNCTYFNFTQQPLQVAVIIGADLMIKQTVLQKCGAFDPVFFMNFEETELCRRITQNGYQIYSIPDAHITHLEGKAAYIKQSRLFYYYQGQYIYFRKIYGKTGCQWIYRITQFKNRIRKLQFIILRNKTKQQYWNMKYNTNQEVWNSQPIQRLFV